MASDTAVAEAPPQAELEQLRPATFQCFTVFGTSQERDIPKALIRLPRRGGVFAKWYSAQWKLIRYELAALGNIAARESIKQEADRKRGWQQLPANMVHRNERARLARRVRALKVAREGEAARWAKIKITLEEMKRLEMEETKRLLMQAKERRVRLKEKAELNQQRSRPWPEKYKEMVNYVEERVAYDCTLGVGRRPRGCALSGPQDGGSFLEADAGRTSRLQPDQSGSQHGKRDRDGHCRSYSSCDLKRDGDVRPQELAGEACLDSCLITTRSKRAWMFELKEFVTRASFVDMFDCVMNMGANTAPFIPKLVTFTRAWMNSEVKRLPLTAFREANKSSPQLRK